MVSNLDTGEPVSSGPGRSEATLGSWLNGLDHAVIVYDPFHIMKLAGEMLDELRRDVFFRAGPELRAIGRGRRWLLLRAWERNSDTDRARLREVLDHNSTLARGYQIKEELREVLGAPDRASMDEGLRRILFRTARYEPRSLRRLHETLKDHREQSSRSPNIARRPAASKRRTTTVRRARGYRDHQYLLRKLRFMVANPIRTNDGLKRFVALGLTPPMPRVQAA